MSRVMGLALSITYSTVYVAKLPYESIRETTCTRREREYMVGSVGNLQGEYKQMVARA